MRTLTSSMNQLHALRRKFEALLEAAREKGTRFGHAPARPKTRLREVTAFGRNPGNLRMLMHVPEQLPSMAPLVVALHGCNQSADEYDYGTGWSSLADRLGFAVVYPEQQPTNNPKNCFSWFVPGDISRGYGEALSIQQMVEHALATFGVDRRRVFVTGLSAGGAMAAVMLATYPESSTHRIADFWCLGEGIIATSRTAAMDGSRMDGRVVVLDGEVVGECTDADDEASFGAPASPSFDPNVVLAEAFKGLSFPKRPGAAARATPHVAHGPGPFIEAALKAAGLMRS
jgi:poly(hydroxyalkanoate) depolymerase family esterase